jgi:uncharacterized repeat protein (TIGR01451 family)
MLRKLLLTVSIVAITSVASAQQNTTDRLFQEILGEAIPKQTQDLKTTKAPTTTPPVRQVQQQVPQINRGPVVSPQNWGTPNPQTRSSVPAVQASSATKPPVSKTPKQTVKTQTNSVSVDLIAPANINLNQTATVRVQLKNIGEAAVSDVKFVATLPEHVRFETARPAPTRVQDGTLEFDAVQLASRSQSFIEIDVVPTRKTPISIGTQIKYNNRNQIAIAVREPVLELQVAGPQEMILGDTKDYTITVVNRGDGIANDLRFTSEFPEGLNKVRSNNTSIAQLAPGQSAQIKVSARGIGSGAKNVKFQLASTELKPITRETPVTILQPELEVTATGPSVNFLNRDGVYRIEIANPGRVNCENVNIDLTIPAEMNVSTISREAKFNEATRQLTWNFPSITAGKTEVIQLKAQCVAEGRHSCGIVVKSNQTVAKEFRLNTNVATRADVSINISTDSGPVQIGAAAEFEIVVENKGSRSAEEVEIVVALPVALTPRVSEDYVVNEYDNTIKFSVGQIRNGQTKKFRFATVGSAQGEHVVRSQLSMAGSARKIIAEDSVYVFESDQSKVGQKLEPQIRRR